MSELTCYYYDEQHNRCKCYVNENLDELLAENAKLQETLQRRNEQFGIMTELWVKQVFDNAKLRELVRDVYSLHWHGADCTECPWFDECDNHGGGCPWLGILADRMRELGIDADGVTIARLRSDRTAQRVIVADGDTDCATGHCECGACGGAIDCWDRFCKHCGAKLED